MYYLNIILLNKKRWIPFLILIVFILLNLYEQYSKVGEVIFETPKALLLFPFDVIPTGYKYIMPVLWIFPIYISMFIGDLYIDERSKGFSELIHTKIGLKEKNKRDYFGYFTSSFLLIFIPLMIGYIITYLFLGSFIPVDPSTFAYRNLYTSMLVNYPNLVGIVQIINIGILSGIVGITVLNLSKVLNNKAQVYMVSFLMFFFLMGNTQEITIFNLISMFSCSSFKGFIQSLIYIISYFTVINLFLLVYYEKKESDNNIL